MIKSPRWGCSMVVNLDRLYYLGSWITPWLIPAASALVFAADDLLYCAFYQYVIRYVFEAPFGVFFRHQLHRKHFPEQNLKHLFSARILPKEVVCLVALVPGHAAVCSTCCF